jgi:hypothetical protein
MDLRERDWQIRQFVYEYFVEHERPPAYEEAAQRFDLALEEGLRAYRRLDAHHALFLEPGAGTVRMAHPLSAVPTPYRVASGGKHYWANCAWDSLGIPAMLHDDAEIAASLATTGEEANYGVRGGRLQAGAFFVHFPLPFRRWYDDLIHT